MKHILIILNVVLVCMLSLGSESKEQVFIIASSNAANIVCQDVHERYYESCSQLRTSIKSLEAQYNTALIKYGWDVTQLHESPGGGVHARNADELEKVRQVLDYKLQQLILIERLKALNDEHTQMKATLHGKPQICADKDDFTDRLSVAKKVEIKQWSLDTNYAETTTTTTDEFEIQLLLKFFQTITLEYDPTKCRAFTEEATIENSYLGLSQLPSALRLTYSVFDTPKLTRLILDDRWFIQIDEDSSIVCRDKAYSYDSGNSPDLDKQIYSIFGCENDRPPADVRGTGESQSGTNNPNQRMDLTRNGAQSSCQTLIPAQVTRNVGAL